MVRLRGPRRGVLTAGLALTLLLIFGGVTGSSGGATANPDGTTASLAAANLILPMTDCLLPGFDPAPAGFRAFHAAALRCLDEVWRPVLEKVGIPFEAARLDTADDLPASTPCGPSPGEDEAVATYCDLTWTISLPRQRLLRSPLTPIGQLAVLAHEYGHHVQKLAGLFGFAGTDAESTRRKELQANCYAGLFAAAVAHAPLGRPAADRLVASTGGYRGSGTHGSSHNQLRWTQLGYRGTTKTCDTWHAPAEAVA